MPPSDGLHENQTNPSQRAGWFNRWTLLIVIATVLSIIGIAGLMFLRKPDGFVDPSTLPQKVDQIQIISQAVPVVYRTQGTVESYRRIDMNSEVAGTISYIGFQEGQPVGKGQTLIRLSANKQAAQQRQSAAGVTLSKKALGAASSDIAQAQANLNALEADLIFAKDEYQRFQKLYDDEFISQLELSQKRAQFDARQARYRQAKQQLEQSQAMAEQAKAQVGVSQAQLGYSQALSAETTIRAPFGGVIGQKYVDLGDYVVPGEKVMTLVDNQQMDVMFSVPEKYSGLLRLGATVMLNAANLSNQPIRARVQFIDPTVNPDTRTIAVKARLDGHAKQYLRDGQFVETALLLDKKDAGIIIPEQALIPQGEAFFVYVVYKDSESGKLKARQQSVTLGERGTGWVEVTDGLKSGDIITTSGLLRLFDGALIAPAKVPHQQAIEHGIL